MKSSNMKFYLCVFQIIIYSIILSIGIWEANIALSNQHLYTVKSEEIEAYIFTIIKSIINIITSLFGICLTCISDDEPSRSNADYQLSMVNFGLSIWAIIMYTNMKVDSDIYGPFRIVIYVEFIIMMLVLSILGLIIIMSCYICIKMSPITNTESIKDNILTSKLINSNLESEYKSQLNNKEFSNTDINILI